MDAGQNWHKVAGNLEENASGSGNGPSCRTAAIIPLGNDTLYLVGTTVGLFRTSNLDGENTVWEQIGHTAFGSTIVEYITYRQSDGLLVVGTFGNGVYQTNLTSVGDVLGVNTINTPSMICVEDSIDSLNWVESIGGLNALIQRTNRSFDFVSEWISKTSWVDFLCLDPLARSNTGITFKINEEWFIKLDDNSQKEVMKQIVKKLAEENVANDINGYPKAPPSFRVWGGGTVEPDDVRTLLPWIDWAYGETKIGLD